MTKEHKDFLALLLDRALPHQLILFALARYQGIHPEELADQEEAHQELLDRSLKALVERLRQGRSKAEDSVLFDLCLAALEERLDRSVREVITAGRSHCTSLLRRHEPLLDRRVADTTLRDYASAHPANEMRKWQVAIEEALLVAQAVTGGEPQARKVREALRVSCADSVRGYCSARARRKQDVDDLVQEAWVAVFTHLASYDPARASFISFARYRVHLVLLASYRDTRLEEILLTDLLRRYPDARNDAEVLEFVMRSKARGEAPSSEPMDPACYKALLHATFNSASPPHQLVAFGFCKLLAWKPNLLVADLSDEPLYPLEKRFEDIYLHVSGMSPDRFHPIFGTLRKNLERPVREVVHHAAYPTYIHILERIVGQTILQDYYTGGDPKEHAASVYHWLYAVKRRTVSKIADAVSQGDEQLGRCFG